MDSAMNNALAGANKCASIDSPDAESGTKGSGSKVRTAGTPAGEDTMLFVCFIEDTCAVVCVYVCVCFAKNSFPLPLQHKNPQ